MVKLIAFVEPRKLKEDFIQNLGRNSTFYAIVNEDNTVEVLKCHEVERDPIQYDLTDFETFKKEYEVKFVLWQEK